MPRWLPEQSQITAPDIASRIAGTLNALRDQILLRTAGRESADRRWATRWMSLFWSIAIGIIATLLPLSILAVLRPAADAPVGAILAIVLVALVAYVADWKGGSASIAAAAIVISRWAVKDGAEPEIAMRYLITSLLVAGIAIVALIERLKTEGSIDRQEALAARSAATALAAVETVAATHQKLSPDARTQLHHAIVRSVVGVNRAHAGALVLADPESGDLEPAALYGFGANAEEALRADAATDDGFVARIRQERRTLQLSGIQRTSGDRYAGVRRTRVKSMLGSPVISQDDMVLGVILVGLLVDHHFTPREVRKLDALASQVASILETMSVMDRREFQLQQAQDEQRRLEQVIATVPEALIVSAPPSGEIIAMNEAAQELFRGVDSGSILLSVKPVDTDDSILSPTERALTFGESANDVECLIERSETDKIPVLASAAPIRDDEGTVVAVVSAFRDISALKEAARLKDEFVSVVSHELRSPLTPIRGFVQLVARDLSREGGHDTQVHRLESVSGHVDRLTRLVDDLLDVSRLRSGTLEIRPVPTDLVDLTKKVVEAWAGGTSPVAITLESDETSLEGHWDPDRIHQVLDNLVINAVKYSPPGAAVVMSLSREENAAVIGVKDQGPGIDDVQKAEIFGAFYRTPDAREGQVQGLGLGLFICQALVAEHGGSIDLVSAPGEGSTFIVRLPTSA
ncbi:MAG: GAF domain-containing protein [Thermomicrobiales bacterium]|nr:GAF domain-containing protein [Thermomicrobiales bacterium]